MSEIAITKKLTETFNPTILKVRNDSDQHAGHAGHDGSGNSHFAVYITAEKFEGMSRVDRQRAIHDCLAEDLKTIHALAITARSPSEEL